MKVQTTLPQDLTKIGSYSRPVNSIGMEVLKIVLAVIALSAMLYAVLFMAVNAAIGDVHLPLMGGLVSLPSFLKKNGKGNRKRESKPNFKIIAEMGQGEKLPSRRQMATENEKRQWEKYPAHMIANELGGAA